MGAVPTEVANKVVRAALPALAAAHAQRLCQTLGEEDKRTTEAQRPQREDHREAPREALSTDSSADGRKSWEAPSGNGPNGYEAPIGNGSNGYSTLTSG